MNNVIVQLISKFYIFFLLTSLATSLSFNFSNFKQNDTNTSLITEGDAVIDTQFIYLTKDNLRGDQSIITESAGRVTYCEPFLLQDNATRKLADFTTTFDFIIQSRRSIIDNNADGLAFFLAPNGSLLYSALGKGGSLGLPVVVSRNQYPFVAVEFDINHNQEPTNEDPASGHVGININSLKSAKTAPWNGGILKGQKNSATISYTSSSKNLSVSVTTTTENGPQVTSDLYHIVDLELYLSERVIVGFSAATESPAFAQHKIISWSFTSTLLADDDSPVPPLPAGSGPKVKSGKHSAVIVISSPIAGLIVVAVIGCLLWYFILWRRRATRSESSTQNGNPMIHDSHDLKMDKEFVKETGARRFSYSELDWATRSFIEAEKLGEGEFGTVYRGFIKDMNSYVAVKKIKNGSKQGLKEYMTEVKIISRLRHRNLVQLIGWCHEKGQLLLVYELLQNGSLHSHLFKEASILGWDIRYKIVQGLAAVLHYLHEECDQYVLHRDINSSNVMLDSNFNPKLGDFGFARLVNHGESSTKTTLVAGTTGYIAPDYVATKKASKESDIYSFGVLALEIACGRKAIDKELRSSEINLVDWIRELYSGGNVMEAADPKLGGAFDVKQMECLMIVGLWCAHSDINVRPPIEKVIEVLNSKTPFPNLAPEYYTSVEEAQI